MARRERAATSEPPAVCRGLGSRLDQAGNYLGFGGIDLACCHGVQHGGKCGGFGSGAAVALRRQGKRDGASARLRHEAEVYFCSPCNLLFFTPNPENTGRPGFIYELFF
jgi:hypothetical protein